jgi:hypothetical protein
MEISPDRVIELLKQGNKKAPFLDDALTYARKLYADDPAGYVDYFGRLKDTKNLNVPLFKKQVEARQTTNNSTAGQAVEFDELAPWPEPVDGCKLLDEIASRVSEYVRLSAPWWRSLCGSYLHSYTTKRSFLPLPQSHHHRNGVAKQR